MHPCSSSSASSCVASSGGGAVAAAAGAAAGAAHTAGSSYSTLLMGGAAVTHAQPFSLRQRHSRPLSVFDCWGLALVWGVFGIGLVLVLLDSVASPRGQEPVQPPSALSQVQQP